MKSWRFRMVRLESEKEVWIGGWIADGEIMEITVDGEVVATIPLDDMVETRHALWQPMET